MLPGLTSAVSFIALCGAVAQPSSFRLSFYAKPRRVPRSLRVPVVAFLIIVIIFFAVVFLFFFLVWFLAKEKIGD
jgi:hypothetical protein